MLGRPGFVLVAVGLWMLSRTESGNVVTANSLHTGLETGLTAKYETAASTMLDSLRRAHSSELEPWPRATNRGRRTVRRRKPVHEDKGLLRLTSVEPLFPLCSYNNHVSWSTRKNETYAVCISGHRTATLGKLQWSGWTTLDKWTLGYSRQSVTFHFNDILYAVVADRTKANGSDLLRFNVEESRMLVDHAIHSRHATAIALWNMLPDDGRYHLAIANSQGPNSDVFQDYTYTYDWRGTYFDHYDSVQSYLVRDLEAFHIYGQAYLFVANRKSAAGVYDVDSQVFQFDLNHWRWKSFQKIQTHAVSDVHFFELGPDNAKEFFLVVANQFQERGGQRNWAVDSVIYKFVADRFVPFQCLRTHGASGVAAHTDPLTGAFLLSISNLYAPVQLFQYDGWKFIPASIQMDIESMAPGATALVFHPWKGFVSERDQLAIVVSNPRKDQEASVFSLSFVSDHPLSRWYSDGLDWCKTAERRFNQTRSTEMTNVLSKAMSLSNSEPIVLQGPVVFQGGLTIHQTLHTSKVIDLHEERVLDYSVLFQLEALHKRLLSVKERIGAIKSAFKVALRTSGTQTVTGHLEFNSLSSSCGSPSGCEIESMKTSQLNSENVENLASRVVFLDQPNNIIGPIKFQELHVQGDIHVSGLVDGVNVSQVVTRQSNRKIYAEKTFVHTVVASNVNVQGTLDEVKISDTTILLTEGTQEVHGETTFTEFQVQNIHVGGLVSGVNLHEFYEDVVLMDSGVQLVTAPKVLTGPLTLRNPHLEKGTVNGLDLVDLWNSAVRLDTEQVVTAPWNFSQLSLTNPLTTQVNGVPIPGPGTVSPSGGELVVSAHQRFLGKVIIDRLHVEESLNGLTRIPSDDTECPDQLDIMLKSCDQTISGKKTIVAMVLSGRNYVTGNLNTFDITGLAEIISHRVQNFSGSWAFNQIDIRAPVLVKGDLIGWEVEHLYRRALKLDQSLPIDARVTFKKPVQVGNMKCGDLNGVDVGRDFLLRHGNAVVTGIKHWQELLLLDNAKAMGEINRCNINFLGDVLLNGPGPQELLHHRIIEGDLVVNQLILGGRLSGLDLSKTIRMDSDITFNVPVQLDSIQVDGELFCRSVNVAGGIVNGQNFLDILNDTMIYSLPQRVLGQKTITGELIVPEGTDLGTHLVVVGGRRLDLSELERDTVYQETPQLIGGKTFAGPVRFNNLLANGSINGISVWDIFNNWLRQDLPQTIVADVTFRAGLAARGVHVVGRINGLDLAVLDRDLVRLSLPVRVDGDWHLGSASVHEFLSLTGRVQGVDLSEEAVSRSSDNVITGRKNFRNMLIDGDLLVDGTINGVDLSDLCLSTARRGIGSKGVSLDELVVHGHLRVAGDISTSAPVNDLLLAQFKESVVMLNESHEFVNVVFNRIVFEKPVFLDGSLNGADLGHLERNYMSLTRAQDIPARIVFQAPVRIDGAIHAGHLNAADETIGTVNIHRLSIRLLTRHSEQIVTSKYIVKGNLHLLRDLTLSASLNGLHFPDDVALKSRLNVVRGPVIFVGDLIVSTDLHLSEGVQVQGVDVSLWASQTVMTTGRFSLTGAKTFRDLHLSHIRAFDVFGSTNISEATVLLEKRPQVVKGKVHFGGSVQVEGSLDTISTINGVDVRGLLEKSVLQSQPSVITGRKVFIAPLTVRRLLTTGFVANVNLTELSLLMGRPRDLQLLHSSMNTSDHSLKLFTNFISGAARRLGHYNSWFRWEDDRRMVLSWDYLAVNSSTRFLIVSTVHGEDCSSLLQYTFAGGTLMQTAILPSSFAVKVKTFAVGSLKYLAVANAHSRCNPEPSGVQIFSLDGSGTWVYRQNLTPLPSWDLSVLPDNLFVPCVFSAVVDQILVHCFDHRTNLFEQKHAVPLEGVIKVSLASCAEGVFLAATAFHHDTTSVHLFAWTDEGQLIPVQKIPIPNLIPGPLLIGSQDKIGNPVCLMVMAHARHNKNQSPVTSVYRMTAEKGLFVKEQDIPVRDVQSVSWSSLPSGDILLALLTPDGVHLHLWRGHAGFVPNDFFHFHGGRSILAFSTKSHHYLAVSGLACSTDWFQQNLPTNVIFRAKLKGA